MKVLMLTHGSYLDPRRVASGNSVRAYYLGHGLLHYGIEVVHVYPAGLGEPANATPAPGLHVRVYDDRRELAALLAEESPDVLLVGFWELLEQLPAELETPIVLDVVAPRVLEAMYQSERDLNDEIRRMLALYRRADRFLVGTQRQRHFLLPWLIMAGFDCRREVPIDVVPISTAPGKPLTGNSAKQHWRLVSGGVIWPWRKVEDYFDAIVAALDAATPRGELVLFSGKYIYAAGDDPQLQGRALDWPRHIVKHSPLLPYSELETFLANNCDIGIELAERNVEREYSQSFRATEFLRSGLPVICNDYLELAQYISDYDAGWIVHAPRDIPALLNDIAAEPQVWARKSANAIRLVEEQFHYQKTVVPLLEFLHNPKLPVRGMALFGAAPIITEPANSAPVAPARAHPSRTRELIKGLAIRFLRRILAAPRRKNPGGHVVGIVSRGDIFPVDHGAAVKIDRTAWGLSHHVAAVYLITDDRRHYYCYRHGQLEQQVYPFWLRSLGPSPEKVRRRLIENGLPESDVFLYYPVVDWSFIARTLYLATRYGINVFQAEFPAYARACLWGRRIFGGKALLVEHNIEYQRLREQYSLTADAAAFLKWIEVELCRQMDAVITVSESDREQLAVAGVDPHLIHAIPHGVDLEQFDQGAAYALHEKFQIAEGRPLLIYHGIYLYPPNLEAMQIMAREILPRLRDRGVQATVIAIGRNPPPQPLDSDIIFTGSVDSVAPYLCGADLAVVPLLHGGGTRMKILDYFAAGLPVVSTSKGVEGIPVEHGREVLISDDYDSFADNIAALLADTERARRIGAAGLSFVETLDWRAIAARYVALM